MGATRDPDAGAVGGSGDVLCLATSISDSDGIGVFTSQVLGWLARRVGAGSVRVLARSTRGADVVPAGARCAVVADRFRYAGRAVLEILRSRPRIVLVFHVSILPMVVVACRLRRVPVVLFAYGIEITRNRRLTDRLAARWVDRVGVISRYTADEFARFAPHAAALRTGRVALTPPRIEDEDAALPTAAERAAARARLGIPPDAAVVLTVARLEPGEGYKGHDRVLRALPGLVDEVPELRYAVVGTGSDESRLRSLAEDLGIADRVVFAGFQQDLRQWYAAADVFAMPSTGEGFGIVFVDALAQGVPVVAGALDGSVTATLAGAVAYLCDPFDGASVAAALRDALTGDEHDPRRDPRHLRRRVVAAFGSAAFDDRLDRLVAGLVDGR